VTLLFSCEQYLAAAEAYLRGIEGRIQSGLDPDGCFLASVFVSRWHKTTMEKVTGELRDKLGIAVATRTYKAYRRLLDSERWLRLANAGDQHIDCSRLVRVQRIWPLQTFSTSRRSPHHSPSSMIRDIVFIIAQFLNLAAICSIVIYARRYENKFCIMHRNLLLDS
jgi:transaldolase